MKSNLPNSITLARQAMATRFEIVLHGGDAAALRAAGEEALQEIDRLEAQLSLYRAGSEIGQLNARAAREPVRVTPELFALEQAKRLSAETGGAFDITIAPLVRCWGFMGKIGGAGSALPASLRADDGAHGVTRPTLPQRSVPTVEEIEAARAVVGMDLVELEAAKRTVRFSREGVMLDLGAIGKGYAIERAAGLLRDAGVTSALIHGGTSTVCAIGAPPGEEHWKVAVEVPQSWAGGPPDPTAGTGPVNRRDACSTFSGTIPLRDCALSVSAIWGRSFEAEGRTLGHVLDPRTGWPVSGALLAAVVLPSATETDALSTALLVRGAEGFDAMAETRPGAMMLLAARDGGLNVKTRGLERVENKVFRD